MKFGLRIHNAIVGMLGEFEPLLSGLITGLDMAE